MRRAKRVVVDDHPSMRERLVHLVHAPEDGPLARRVRSALLADGHECAAPGATGGVAVLLFTSRADESGDVLAELQRLGASGVPLIPVMCEDLSPSAAMEDRLAAFSSLFGWVDATSGRVSQLLHAVEGALAQQGALLPHEEEKTRPSRKGPLRVAVAAAAVLVAVLAASVLMGRGAEPARPEREAPTSEAAAPSASDEAEEPGRPDPTPPSPGTESGAPSGSSVPPPPGEPRPTTECIDLGGGVKLDLALIEPGEFLMGSPEGEKGRGDEETQHAVKLTRAFHMGVTEVTQAQWMAVMRTTPGHFRGDALPVEQVSWDDARTFCDRLSQRTGSTYRLPTEAEWEYACRGGTTEARYGPLDEVAWHRGNSDGATHEVAGKRANGYGLYDMLGNVQEWCSDWHGPYAGSATGVRDPVGSGFGGARVLRGGSWRYDAETCRAAFRGNNYPSGRLDYVGFRVVTEGVGGRDAASHEAPGTETTHAEAVAARMAMVGAQSGLGSKEERERLLRAGSPHPKAGTFSQTFRRADLVERAADEAMEKGDYVSATRLFAEAEGLYRQAAGLKAALDVAEQVREKASRAGEEADKAFRGAARPASFERAKQALEDGEKALQEEDADKARALLEQAAAEFGKAKADADTARDREATSGGAGAAADPGKGPRFRFPEYEKAFAEVDWDEIGVAVSNVVPLLAQLLGSLEKPGDVPNFAELQRWNAPLAAAAVKLAAAGVRGTGVNGTFASAAVSVNVIHATLKAGQQPLSAEQQTRLDEIGRRYAAEEVQRLAAYPEGTLAIRRLADDAAMKDRFFAEIDGMLTPKQRDVVHPESVRGFTGLDLFSSGIVTAGDVRQLDFKDREVAIRQVTDRQFERFGLDRASRPIVEQLVRSWAERVAKAGLAAPREKSVRAMPLLTRVARVTKAAQLQADLCEELQRRVPMTDGQKALLAGDTNILVPFR
jgi:formylglycine-generating enzyme required for sulfatase activity